MTELAQLVETLGTILLLGAVVGIFYVFYMILRFTFRSIKENDD